MWNYLTGGSLTLSAADRALETYARLEFHHGEELYLRSEALRAVRANGQVRKRSWLRGLIARFRSEPAPAARPPGGTNAV